MRKKSDDKKSSLTEFKKEIMRIVPDIKILEKEAERIINNIQVLSDDERQTLIQSLERVYYIIFILKELTEFFKEKISFGGGSVLNYLFISSKDEAPRFTYDLDANWNLDVSNKRELLEEIVVFNAALSERYKVRLPVDERRYLDLYQAEYDIEKDYFPDILSLRMPVLMRWSGLEFYRYVRSVANINMSFNLIRRLRKIFEEVLKIRDAKIDYIRFEISFKKDMPYKSYEIELPFEFGREKINITVIEYQMASKIIEKLGKDYGDKIDLAAHDIIKTILDLRYLRYCDLNEVARYIDVLSEKYNVKKDEIMKNIVRNIRYVEKYLDEYMKKQYYILIRRKYSSREIISIVESMLKTLGLFS